MVEEWSRSFRLSDLGKKVLAEEKRLGRLLDFGEWLRLQNPNAEGVENPLGYMNQGEADKESEIEQ